MYTNVFPVQRGFETISHFYELVYGKQYEIPQGYIGGSYPAFMMALLPDVGFEHINIMLPNDVDIFATSREYAESIVEKLEGIDYQIEGASDHVWSLVHRDHIGIQVIEPKPQWVESLNSFTGDLLSDFDLLGSRAVLLDSDHVLADCDVPSKSSKILKISNPLRTMTRVLKYHKRGFEFPDNELIKIFQAWDSLSDDRKADIIASTEIQEGDDPEYYDDVWFEDDDWYDGE